MNYRLILNDRNDFSLHLPEFVLFMGMFFMIILTNAMLKIFLFLHKINYPDSKLTLLFSSTKSENSK